MRLLTSVTIREGGVCIKRNSSTKKKDRELMEIMDFFLNSTYKSLKDLRNTIRRAVDSSVPP